MVYSDDGSDTSSLLPNIPTQPIIKIANVPGTAQDLIDLANPPPTPLLPPGMTKAVPWLGIAAAGVAFWFFVARK